MARYFNICYPPRKTTRRVMQIPEDGFLSQISPEDHLTVEVCVQGHSVAQLLYYLCVLSPFQSKLSDVSPVCEDQRRLFAYNEEDEAKRL